jgi:Ca-activated chloride channel family protein
VEQVRSNGEQKELRDEIVDLGTRYGIVTPYTSYLALENQTSLNMTTGGQPGRPVTRRALSNLSPGVGAPSATPQSAVTVTGEQAIGESKAARAQQNAFVLDGADDKTSVARQVAGKTFYLIDDVWTDSEFKAESGLPETVLVFGSDDYFALLQQKSKLGSYFSLGERVVVVFEGRVYRVNVK